jgi:hypothetical protein
MVTDVRTDVPVTAVTTPTGRPASITASGYRYRVRQILGEWPTRGNARLYRLQLHAEHETVVADVVDPGAGCEPRPWRLRGIWR